MPTRKQATQRIASSAAKKRATTKVARKSPAAAPAAKNGKAKPSSKPRVKLVRDSFTMPESDFALVAALKKKAVGAARETKKSELLRAGLRALQALEAKALVAALDRLEPIKIGRPKKGH